MSMLEDMIAGAGGTPSAFTKDTPQGTVIGGRVVDVAVRQHRDFESGEPQFWEDGQPMQQVAVIVQTDLRDPAKPDDDGRRGIYVKWWGDQRKALIEAVKASGDTDVRVGGEFYCQFVGTKPNEKNPRLNDSKIYAYKYVKPATGLDFSQVGQQPAQQAPAAAAQAPAAQPAAAPMTAPASQPVQQAAPAPAQSDGGNEQLAKARQFIGLGMTDAEIAGATGLPVEAVAAIRNAPPA